MYFKTFAMNEYGSSFGPRRSDVLASHNMLCNQAPSSIGLTILRPPVTLANSIAFADDQRWLRRQGSEKLPLYHFFNVELVFQSCCIVLQIFTSFFNSIGSKWIPFRRGSTPSPGDQDSRVYLLRCSSSWCWWNCALHCLLVSMNLSDFKSINMSPADRDHHCQLLER